MPALFSPLVERAMRLAGRNHRHQQRKQSDIPYFTHLASVALILSLAGFDDDELIAAALLHDIVEDTDITIDDIAGEFPENVVAWVAATTEKKTDAQQKKQPWQIRKEEHLARLEGAPLEVKAIVLADKLHNLGTMLYDIEAGDDLWNRFGAPPEKIVWYHRSILERAASDDLRLQQLAQECREQLEQLETSLEKREAEHGTGDDA